MSRPAPTRTLTLAGDGTVVAETRTGDDPRYGPLRGTSRGTWSVEGDRLALRDMRLEAGAAGPGGHFDAPVIVSLVPRVPRVRRLSRALGTLFPGKLPGSCRTAKAAQCLGRSVLVVFLHTYSKASILSSGINP
jgi:hypothetical protein